MSKPIVALIVAVARNGVIGNAGQLPWHIPEDMKWFKEKTLRKPCIMGRKTWESLPRRPLPGRLNIVVSRDPAYNAEGARGALTFDDALVIAAHANPEEIMVLGGAEVYRAAWPKTDRIYFTRVHRSFDGDTLFPAVIEPEEWAETIVAECPTSPERGVGYTFSILNRK